VGKALKELNQRSGGPKTNERGRNG
jgi:hypothetical protein